MKLELTSLQKKNQAEFKRFADEKIIPLADLYDREERIPSELLSDVAARRYFGAILPRDKGGLGLDMMTFGLLSGEIGRGCSSLRSLLTVHSMVTFAIAKWGTAQQKEHWLPKLASGEVIAAFGLSEPDVGSDGKNVRARARLEGDWYLLDGQKKWITGGQIANLFLIFAGTEGKPSAFLVERERQGLSTRPIVNLLGVRASFAAELFMNECPVPKQNLLGRDGLGFSHVASSALDLGRYSVAWGCVGIARGCLQACLRYTSERTQFGVHLKNHQLISRLITEMITDTNAAELLCYKAGYLKDTNDPSAVLNTCIAKYYASRAANRIASDAVQIHGANGCSSDYPVQRYFRDARIMEIIEGSTQIQQLLIAEESYIQYLS